MNMGAPVNHGSLALDHARRGLILSEPERLDQHREPGPEFVKSARGDRNRLALARACDAERRILGEHRAHPCQLPVNARRVQLTQQLLDIAAISHAVLSFRNERISAPICRYALAAYGMTPPIP